MVVVLLLTIVQMPELSKENFSYYTSYCDIMEVRCCMPHPHSRSLRLLRVLLPEAAAHLLWRKPGLLANATRKVIARLEPALIGDSADGQACLFEHFHPLHDPLLPEIRNRRERYMFLKEAYQVKRTHRRE